MKKLLFITIPHELNQAGWDAINKGFGRMTEDTDMRIVFLEQSGAKDYGFFYVNVEPEITMSLEELQDKFFPRPEPEPK